MTTPVSNATTPANNALGNVLASMIIAPAQVAAALAGALTQRAAAAAVAVPTAGCGCGTSTGSGAGVSGCEIPPPCWEPKPAGNCALQVTPGGTAIIRLHVSNCGWTRQVVALTAAGRIASVMTLTPTARVIGPQEGADFRVTIQVPAGARAGASLTGPLIIRGCRDHFVRVTITVADCVTGSSNCCDVHIDDCADQLHHWYDHFYCPRPCNPVRDPGKGDVQGGGIRVATDG